MSLNSSDSSSVDWGRVAAEWASQRAGSQNGPPPPQLPNNSNNPQMGGVGMPPYTFPPPQMPFPYPGMFMPFPGVSNNAAAVAGGFGMPFGMPPLAPHPMMFYNMHQRPEYAAAPTTTSNGEFRPPPFVPPAPATEVKCAVVASRAAAAPSLPRWLAEAVKNKEEDGVVGGRDGATDKAGEMFNTVRRRRKNWILKCSNFGVWVFEMMKSF